MNREEQIEKARELLACGVLSKEACDAIKNDFPELAESEDERIRKELIEQVGYIFPDKEEYDDEGRVLPTYHKRIGRYRAYLEKQKEQQPAEWSEEDERIFNELLDHCNTENATWYNFLKSLRPSWKSSDQ